MGYLWKLSCWQYTFLILVPVPFIFGYALIVGLPDQAPTTTNMAGKAISSIAAMGFPMKTLDPFLFCVYHLDHYPAGDSSMRAPRRGDGADFNTSAPYRMYHGDDIPGFPQVSQPLILIFLCTILSFN
jgi:hypothetical protein